MPRRGLGWKRQEPDGRDYKFHDVVQVSATTPSVVDLRQTGWLPTIYDQGQIGSCVPNAVAADFAYIHTKEGFPPFGSKQKQNYTPSRLEIYYWARDLEGTVPEDAGSTVRDCFKVVATRGVTGENLWPYSDANPGPFLQRPGAQAIASASLHKSLQYLAVNQTESMIKAALAAQYPVVFGFDVFASFETDEVAQTGEVPDPNMAAEALLGGHGVMLVGYSDATRRYLVRNSWGKDWGQQGYFTMSYDYVHDARLASDFWTLRAVQK